MPAETTQDMTPYEQSLEPGEEEDVTLLIEPGNVPAEVAEALGRGPAIRYYLTELIRSFQLSLGSPYMSADRRTSPLVAVSAATSSDEGYAVKISKEDHLLLKDLQAFVYRGLSLGTIAGILFEKGCEAHRPFLEAVRAIRSQLPHLAPDQIILKLAHLAILLSDDPARAIEAMSATASPTKLLK